MLIVIEGPNLIGKSYLISQLKYNTIIGNFIHIDPPLPRTRKDIYDFLALIQYMSKRNTFMITEKHPVIRDLLNSEIANIKPNIAWEDLSNLKKQDISGYVYCRPDDEFLQKKTPTDYQFSENLAKIVRIYDRFFAKDLPRNIPRITYNYRIDNVSKIFKFINDIVNC